jgi:hypothetical protein
MVNHPLYSTQGLDHHLREMLEEKIGKGYQAPSAPFDSKRNILVPTVFDDRAA